MKPTEPQFITIGRILAPWDFQGQIKVEVLTDFPERFTEASTVYINQRPMTIDSVEWHKGKAIIKLATIDCEKDAEKLRGQLVEIHHSQLQALPEGQYYQFQLIGLEVRTKQEELVGEISDILPTSNNDIYVVSGDDGEILIPATDEIVKSIDLDRGVIIIEPVKGLLGLNKKAAK
ncbi:MAG: ribosome maturation factor RimM [Chloroflexota bacterium]